MTNLKCDAINCNRKAVVTLNVNENTKNEFKQNLCGFHWKQSYD